MASRFWFLGFTLFIFMLSEVVGREGRGAWQDKRRHKTRHGKTRQDQQQRQTAKQDKINNKTLTLTPDKDKILPCTIQKKGEGFALFRLNV